MNKMNLMTVLLACLALGACSNDDEQVPQQPEPQPLPEQTYPLTIEVTENPMTVDGEESSSSSRAAITTNSTLNEFSMSYVYNTSETGIVTATKDEVDGKWKDKYEDGWPISAGADGMVNWYAYTGGTFNLNGGTPYINFTVDENAATQKDLLVATASGTYSGTGGKLSFSFDHACAALRFYVKKAKNLDGHTLSVSSIVLKNVIKQAKYYYGTGWGDLYTDRSVYTLYSGSAQTLGSTDYIAMDGGTPSYLFLIPQTLTPWDHTTAIASATTQSYLEVTCSINGGGSQTAYIPFGATFAKGKKYDVKINIGKNSLYSGPNTKVIP